MNLLVISQAIDQNDQNQGAFYAWWQALARSVYALYLVGLRTGAYDCPENTTVYSLGKESGRTKGQQVQRFAQILRQTRGTLDGILVHQCPQYVFGATLIAPTVPRFMWYAMGGKRWQTWVAEKMVRRVFTSTPQGFELPSSKLSVIGQGIDPEQFTLRTTPFSTPLRLLYIGRISPQKDLDALVRTSQELSRRNIPHRLTIAGGAMTPSSREYEQTFRQSATKTLGERIVFLGAVPHQSVPALLAEQDILLNPSKTGSLDKTMLEAMAGGVPPLAASQALAAAVPEALRPTIVLSDTRPESFVHHIVSLAKLDPNSLQRLRQTLRDAVARDHSADRLTRQLVDGMTRELVRGNR